MGLGLSMSIARIWQCIDFPHLHLHLHPNNEWANLVDLASVQGFNLLTVQPAQLRLPGFCRVAHGPVHSAGLGAEGFRVLHHHVALAPRCPPTLVGLEASVRCSLWLATAATPRHTLLCKERSGRRMLSLRGLSSSAAQKSYPPWSQHCATSGPGGWCSQWCCAASSL